MLGRLRFVLSALAVLAFAGAAVISLGCGDGDSYTSQVLVAGPEARATATSMPPLTPPTPAAPTVAPVTLLVTPQPASYRVLDPTFTPLSGARAYHGVDQGAAYQIEVPDRWNGDLVVYAHGYRAYSPELKVDPPRLRQHFIDQGYAWAASSYRSNGYSVGVGVEDTRHVAGLVSEIVGQPRRTYLYGTSLGGHVVTHLMERHPTEFDGALSECGAVAGVGVLDYFASWTIVASHLTGVEDGLSKDPDRYQAAVFQMAERLGPADAPTLVGGQFESIISELTGGPRPWRHEGFRESMGWNFFLLLDALRHPELSVSAASNQDVRYQIAPGLGLTEEELNRTVPRLAAVPDVRDGQRFPALAPVSGAIQRPFLTLHNTGDLFVPINQEQILRRAVRAAGNDPLLVQRAIRRPGHCNFTPQEVSRAFDDLVRWVEQGVRPSGDDLLGNLMEAGLAFTEPLEPGDPGTP